jgi:glycosyltransferase involved in cell wall biosynthesis
MGGIMIDVIIPAFNSQDTIEKCVGSIVLQNKIEEIRITIVDDCSDRDYSEVVDRFGDQVLIRQIRTPENVGSGLARQYGVDHTGGQFIVFVDADDLFCDMFGIAMMLRCMEDPKCVCISAPFWEDGGDGNFRVHEKDLTWVFSKMYRRSYLDKYGIRFNKTRACEDVGFNSKVLMNCGDDEYVKFVDKPIYIWSFKEDSITRKNDGEYSYRQGVIGYVENKMDLISGVDLNDPKYKKEVFSNLVDMYYHYMIVKLRKPEFADEVFNKMVEYYQIVKEQIPLKMDYQEIADLFYKRIEYRTENIIPDITFFEFLKKLMSRRAK